MLALLLFALFLPAPVDPEFDPALGLVAHYSFDYCDGRSELPNGTDARVYGAAGCQCGVVGQAMVFDGQRSYLEFGGPLNDYFTTSDFTLSFYLHPDGHRALPQALFTKDASCTRENMLALRYTSGTREMSSALHETPHKNYRHLEYTLLKSGWLHYTLVREGPEARTYLNGELQRRTRRCSGVDLSNAVDLTFAKPQCRAVPFKGLLDEFRLYDRALSDGEVRLLYQRHPVETAGADCITQLKFSDTENLANVD